MSAKSERSTKSRSSSTKSKSPSFIDTLALATAPKDVRDAVLKRKSDETKRHRQADVGMTPEADMFREQVALSPGEWMLGSSSSPEPWKEPERPKTPGVWKYQVFDDADDGKAPDRPRYTEANFGDMASGDSPKPSRCEGLASGYEFFDSGSRYSSSSEPGSHSSASRSQPSGSWPRHSTASPPLPLVDRSLTSTTSKRPSILSRVISRLKPTKTKRSQAAVPQPAALKRSNTSPSSHITHRSAYSYNPAADALYGHIPRRAGQHFPGEIVVHRTATDARPRIEVFPLAEAEAGPEAERPVRYISPQEVARAMRQYGARRDHVVAWRGDVAPLKEGEKDGKQQQRRESLLTEWPGQSDAGMSDDGIDSRVLEPEDSLSACEFASRERRRREAVVIERDT